MAAYVYDAVGSPTAVTAQSGVTTYGYDALDRLVDVCFAASCPGAGDPFIRYAYDAVGNRTTETRPAGVTRYSYDAGDRLLSSTGPGGTTTYVFDANGNQTEAGARTFAYDLANRMSSITLAGATTTYGYDGDGTRLSVQTGSSSTSFLWDVNFGLPQLALERDGAGATVRSYLHGRGPVSFYGRRPDELPAPGRARQRHRRHLRERRRPMDVRVRAVRRGPGGDAARPGRGGESAAFRRRAPRPGRALPPAGPAVRPRRGTLYRR